MSAMNCFECKSGRFAKHGITAIVIQHCSVKLCIPARQDPSPSIKRTENYSYRRQITESRQVSLVVKPKLHFIGYTN
jgi:hypothetical protein